MLIHFSWAEVISVIVSDTCPNSNSRDVMRERMFARWREMLPICSGRLNSFLLFKISVASSARSRNALRKGADIFRVFEPAEL
ncbi:unnamed protein product [Meloidogyne enterolobii]|uniref:Uncharacterized protein n=1 Tax=Meloidogyne enterolobii TaxID=390850 RepID=A0ACB0YSE1_MELEN